MYQYRGNWVKSLSTHGPFMPASTLPGRDAEPMAYSEPYQYAFIVASLVWMNDCNQKFFQNARCPSRRFVTSAVVIALTAEVARPASVAADGPPPPCRASLRNTVASSTVFPPDSVKVPVTVEPLVFVLAKPTPTGRTAIAAALWKSLLPLRLLCRVATMVPPDPATVVGYVVCESGPGSASATLSVTVGLPAGLDSSVTNVLSESAV